MTTTRTIPTARLSPKAVPYLGVNALVAVLSALIFSPQSWALDIPSIFGSGMMLQREKPVVVWGWTAPGDVVDLSFAGQSRSATADPAGRWEVMLDPLSASSEPRRMTISSAKGETRVYDNVLVGDVWILAGQSNMGWPLSKCDGGAEAAREADFPWLRVFRQAAIAGASDEPARDVSGGKWSTCQPQNAGDISGVGFFFARALHKATNVPVGLVSASMGGTRIQSWIDAETLRSLPQSARYFKWEQDARQTHAEDEAEWKRLVEDLEKQRQEASLRGEPPPAKLSGRLANGPPLGVKMFRRHSALFNGKVAPIQPFAARGVIWYQGEGNTIEAKAYGPMLEALILRWREGWRAPQLPFLLVQLPRFRVKSDWAGLREAQETVARKTKGVHLAVTIDTGRENDIHPGDKLPVGERLALLARREILGEDGIAARAPRAFSAVRNGDSVEVKFELDGTTLQKTPDTLAGFAWVNAAGESHPADAQVTGPDRVRVAAPAEAVGITYAFESWPEVSLFDTAGLPAAPFRLPIGPP